MRVLDYQRVTICGLFEGARRLGAAVSVLLPGLDDAVGE
jgi:hypothetical protein